MPSELDFLKQRVVELEEIHRLGQSLTSILNVYETLEMIGDVCRRLCHAERAAIVLMDLSREDSIETIVRGVRSPGEEIDHTVNTLVAGWMAINRKPFRTDDVLESLGLRNPAERLRPLGAALALSLEYEGAWIGFINLVNSKGGHRFSDDDLRLLVILAPLAAHFIHRASLHESLFEENNRLKAALVEARGPDAFIGGSELLNKVREKIRLVAPSTATVLLIGETGTGKEMAARAIHVMGPRADKPFVAVNCAAIPASLSESELFGHEKGAFTGAANAHKGKFELAHTGTIFLDEISSMPLELQAKLLRVLEGRAVTRLGSSDEVKVDVRVIAATNKDLEMACRKGEFREDLYHRLNVAPIRLPPLRERREDIEPLLSDFLAQYSGTTKRFTEPALEKLRGLMWSGNVRELRNLVERISIFVPGPEITVEDLGTLLGGGESSPGASPSPLRLADAVRPLLTDNAGGRNVLEDVEKELVKAALTMERGNITRASKILGIDRNAMQRRLEKFGLTRFTDPDRDPS